MAEYFTADWHIGYRDMWLIGRPFEYGREMDCYIIEQHNAVVQDGDTVYVIGDALNSDAGHLAPMLAELNGDLVLIRGNHDSLTNEELHRYFVAVIPEGEGVELDVDGLPCWLTHYPTQSRADRFNLVGHVHSRWQVQKNMLNVGVDVHHFQPVSVERVGFYFTAIREFYDQDVWCADHPVNVAHEGRGAPGTYLATRRVQLPEEIE